MAAVYVLSGTIASVAVVWIICDLVRFKGYEQDAKVMCGLRICVWLVMLYLAVKTAWRVHLHEDIQAAVPYIAYLAIGQWPAIFLSLIGPSKRRRN